MSNLLRIAVLAPEPFIRTFYYKRKKGNSDDYVKTEEPLWVEFHFEHHKERNYPLEFNFRVFREKNEESELLEAGRASRLFSGGQQTRRSFLLPLEGKVPVTCKFLMNAELDLTAYFPRKSLDGKLTSENLPKGLRGEFVKNKIETIDGLVFYMLNSMFDDPNFSFVQAGLFCEDYRCVLLQEVIAKRKINITSGYCEISNNFSKNEKIEIFRNTLEKCKNKMIVGQEYLDESFLAKFIGKQLKLLESI